MSWVDVWRVPLTEGADTALLDPAERERAARFKFERDRIPFVAAHTALTRILTSYLGARPQLIVGSHGKPALSPPRFHFNLSHSGDLALIAVSGDREVGVDVELVRPLATDPAHFFSPAELAALDSVPRSERTAAFFLAWTRKESYIKARGLGLSLPLDSFDVELRPGAPARLLATRPDAEDATRWCLHHLEVGPGYAAALTIEGEVERITIKTEG